jgi:hypothetical protein
VARNKKAPVPIELKRGITKEIMIDIKSWANRYWPSGTCSKNERKILGCKTSEMLEFRIFARVKTMKARFESSQIKLAIAASILNLKFVCATFPFISRVRKVIARRTPTKKKLEVIAVNLKRFNKALINDWLIFR